jgi:DNA recombination protein RmuC
METLLIFIAGLALGVVLTLFLKKKTTEAAPDNHALDQLRSELQEVKTGRQNAQNRIEELTRDLAISQQNEKNIADRLAEERRNIQELQEQFRKEFENMANEILEKKSEKFTEQNQKNLETILKPLGEKLKEFEKKVEDTYEKGQKETISLKTEIKGLMELNEKMRTDATNLTKALKGDVKIQGNWGETILLRLLESSGLAKDREYFVQESLTSDEGKRLQPDVVIHLPDNKVVIVDSKVSLVAWERYVNEEDPDQKALFLKAHIESVKTHSKSLSAKSYQNLHGKGSLDFVLMFMPIEGAFSAALQSDQNLFQEAFDRNVVLVTTSTLMATLRTIGSIWKNEYTNQNAIEIADRGAKMYDKFVAFTQDLVGVGQQMDRAKDKYKEAMGKLVEGRGNLVSQAESMRKLGLKNSKTLDQNILNRSGVEEAQEDYNS